MTIKSLASAADRGAAPPRMQSGRCRENSFGLSDRKIRRLHDASQDQRRMEGRDGCKRKRCATRRRVLRVAQAWQCKIVLLGVSIRPRAFFLLLGSPGGACSGVFIEENTHRCTSPALHLQEKCSNARIILDGMRQVAYQELGYEPTLIRLRP